MNVNAIPREELFERLRRATPRYQFHVHAELVWQSRRSWGRVVNISQGGMFIEVENPFRVNTVFSAYLALNAPLHLICKVARISPGRGIGVSILVPRDAKPRFSALMVALVSSVDPTVTMAMPPTPPSRLIVRAAAAGGR
jgi:hypothetical protein